MFTRNSQAEPRPLQPAPASNGALRKPLPQAPHQRPAEPGPKSVIGNDLKIVGSGLRIISQGTLQVDGEIEGDVGGAEVIIGEEGRVTGTVAAERVIVRGRIAGIVRGVTVTLQSTAQVEGDIHHVSLAIEQGAEFDGRCRRAAEASALATDLEVAGP
jgi:cytoskeletal protein CcmA (bactofilin family)